MTLTYGYDGDSNETSVSDSLGGVVSYTYDARDELTNEKFSGTGISAEAVTYSYDNAGRLTGITRYSNLAETTEVAATAYSYDHANRMTGIVDSNSTGTTLVSYGYTYDAADRVTQEVADLGFGRLDRHADLLVHEQQPVDRRDAHERLVHERELHVGQQRQRNRHGLYDGHGQRANRLARLHLHLRQRRRDDLGDADVDGRRVDLRLRFPRPDGDGGREDLGWHDARVVTYTYDALDNRIGMDENGTQTWTLYDRGNPIMDFNGSGSLTMRYLWGPTGIVARQTSGGTVSWYLADQLGTVRDLINNSGAIIDHVDFSAFGTVLGETSPTSGDRIMGFAMLERDTVTGLNLAVYREENPGTGRWDSQDPLGFAAGDDNLYGYVDNGPTGSIDPTGLQYGQDGRPTKQYWEVPRDFHRIDRPNARRRGVETGHRRS